jgi:hypothetical protein
MDIPHRGPFPFGAPYNTLGIRITNEDDGEILPRTYSYWPNVNANLGRDTLRVFLGTSRGPCQWLVDKCSHEVTPLGPIFPAGHALAGSTAEGWYWDTRDPHVLYCSDDKHLYRYDVETQALTTVVDITPLAWRGEFALRQWHTSAVKKTHSATVKQIIPDGAWPSIGTIVYDEAKCQSGLGSPWAWFPILGPLDESQIDRTGDWLLIKETFGPEVTPGLERPVHSEDNRIINPVTRAEQHLLDEQGAAGHSDNGFGYMVAADNWQNEATWRVWAFDQVPAQEGYVILTSPWDRQVIHVSHCNARPGPPTEQWVLGSGTLEDLIMIPLDGSMQCRPVAPSMSDGDSYDDLPKANIDPPGKYALWTRRDAGRFDAFMVKL